MYDGNADQVARTPIALDEAPRSGHIDRVPGVPESVALKADARLVAGRLAVALDHDTMQASITVQSGSCSGCCLFIRKLVVLIGAIDDSS